MKERQRLHPTVEYVFWQLVLGVCLIVEGTLEEERDKSRKKRLLTKMYSSWPEVKARANQFFAEGKFLGSEILLADAIWIADLPPSKISFKISAQLANYQLLLTRLLSEEEETPKER